MGMIFLLPLPGLGFDLGTVFPRLTPWAIIARHSVAEKDL